MHMAERCVVSISSFCSFCDLKFDKKSIISIYILILSWIYLFRNIFSGKTLEWLDPWDPRWRCCFVCCCKYLIAHYFIATGSLCQQQLLKLPLRASVVLLYSKWTDSRPDVLCAIFHPLQQRSAMSCWLMAVEFRSPWLEPTTKTILLLTWLDLRWKDFWQRLHSILKMWVNNLLAVYQRRHLGFSFVFVILSDVYTCMYIPVCI